MAQQVLNSSLFILNYGIKYHQHQNFSSLLIFQAYLLQLTRHFQFQFNTFKCKDNQPN